MIDKRKVFFKIIVPNFNNYIYIKKCLDSIKEQTFKDYVCIVVDDLSTDDSFKIAQIYAKRDPEHFIAIKMDKKLNAGGARNIGIEYDIDSEYMWFIDGDDFIYSDNSLMKAYENLKDLKTDILLFKWQRIFEKNENRTFNGSDTLFEKWKYRLANCPWNGAPLHISKSSIVQKFIEKCGFGEDSYHFLKMFNQLNTPIVKQISDIMYIYRTHDDSTCQRYILNNEGIRATSQHIFYEKLKELALMCVNECVYKSIMYRLNDKYLNTNTQIKNEIEKNLENSIFLKTINFKNSNNISKQFDENLNKILNRPIQKIVKPNIELQKKVLNYQYKFINSIFEKSSFTRNIDNTSDIGIIWGNAQNEKNLNTLGFLINNPDSCVFLCEDGFIRSYDTWANPKSPENLKQSCSLLVDTLGYYFDATRPTLIENMLNDKTIIISDEQKKYARKMIDKIVSNKISKYNHQPLKSNIDIGKRKHKVLVVDQSYGDYSISKGMANEYTFQSMLNDAISQNPNSDILVKTHPDAMVKNGIRSGYYQGIQKTDRIIPITQPINPFSLMECVDDVYVCSSQFGFEALMMNKKVHTYGIPFYSNWGVTIDTQKCFRRTNKRNLEEIFYIFYIMYTFWYNPETKKRCDIETVINYMIKNRRENNENNKNQ